MAAAREQFLGRRSAFGAGEVDAQPDAVRKRVGEPRRSGESVEMALAREEAEIAIGRVRLQVARSRSVCPLGAQLAQVDLLQREQAELAGGILRQEGLVADDVEVAVEELHARSAAPAAMIVLHQLKPAFDPLVVEGGADRSVLLQLEMPVIGIAGTQPDLLEEAAAGIDFAAQIEAVLKQAQARSLLLLARSGRVADRHAVEAVIMAVGNAQAAGVGDDRRADARGPCPGEAVGKRVLQCRRRCEVGVVGRGRARSGGKRPGTRGGRQDIATDMQVVALQIGAVGMQHDLAADRDVAGPRNRTLVRGRAVAADRVEAIAILRHAARDSGCRSR